MEWDFVPVYRRKHIGQAHKLHTLVGVYVASIGILSLYVCTDVDWGTHRAKTESA